MEFIWEIYWNGGQVHGLKSIMLLDLLSLPSVEF
jgi:hypothetical protein